MKRTLVWTFGGIAVATLFLLGFLLKDRIVEFLLISRLDSPEESVRVEALRRLAEMPSTRVVFHLMEKLVLAETRESRWEVYELFSNLDDELRIRVFVRALLGKDSRYRVLAGDALALLARDTIMGGQIGNVLVEKGAAAEPFLAGYLSSRKEPKARTLAAEVLINIRPETEEAIGALTAALGDPSPAVRKSSAMALGFIAGRARRSIPGLIGLMQDPDEGVRKWALWSLCKLGAAGDQEMLAALSSGGMAGILRSNEESLEGETRRNAEILLRLFEEQARKE